MQIHVNNANASLSDREAQVADLLSRGMSEKEIADALKISVDTVNNHTRHIRQKKGLTKNLEILLWYISKINGKEFNLQKIREQGIGVILLLVNVCNFLKPV